MLKGIHILLTYTCTFECDHCFLYCSPRSEGTFTIPELRNLIDQATNVESIESVCFEGGEPLLYLPQLLEGISYATSKGFTTGIVTNAYIARSAEDAKYLLSILAEAGLDSITVSDDALHFGDLEQTPAKNLVEAAEHADRPVSTIAVEEPCSEAPTGSVMFRGRAADNMTEGVPRRTWEEMKKCPTENPRDPGRVHIDPFGEVLFCQGISMGNVWKTPLAQIFESWDPETHPVCGPLLEGGPAALAKAYGVCEAGDFVDECHLCFEVRRHIIDQVPLYLTPPQVYGL